MTPDEPTWDHLVGDSPANTPKPFGELNETEKAQRGAELEARFGGNAQTEGGVEVSLKEWEKPIDGKTEDELKDILSKMQEYENAQNSLGIRLDDSFYNKRFAVMDKLEDLRLDAIENQMRQEIQPSGNWDRINKFATSRRPGMGEEGLYGSGKEYVADLLTILSSDLPKEEKLKMLDGIGSQIESSVIGDDYSKVARRLIKKLS